MNQNIELKNIFIVLLMFFLVVGNVYSQEPINQQDALKINQYTTQYEKYVRENNLSMQTECLNKLGNLYWELEYLDKAVENFKKSLSINEQLGSKNAIYHLNLNLGMIADDNEDFNTAISYYKKSLEIQKILNNTNKHIDVLIKLASAYLELKDYNSAQKYLDDALELAQEVNDNQSLKNIYGILIQLDEATNNKNALLTHQALYSNQVSLILSNEKESIALAKANAERVALTSQNELITQSLYLKQTTDSLAKVEALSKEQLMENEIQRQKIALQTAEMERQKAQADSRLNRQIRNTFIVAFSIVLLFLFLLMKLFADKRKANKLLAIQNNTLEKQKREIQDKNFILETQKEEILQKNEILLEQKREILQKNAVLMMQKEEIEQQKNELDKKNKQITDSINYASKIQEAILPSRKAIKQHFPESFIFYKPKDIVSGDFYWFSKHGEKIFIAAVDCTGHSVPGAFMSMIGNTLLNEIINEKRIFNPAEILEKLNIGIINTLKGNDGVSNDAEDDGMEITLCCFDRSLHQLEVACAGHFLYMYQNDDFKTIQGDTNVIGGMFSGVDTKYTSQLFDFQKKDIVYLFSDGFADQFGAATNSKYYMKNFKKFLSQHTQLELNLQGELLEEEFLRWRGNKVQTDDILVIGLQM